MDEVHASWQCESCGHGNVTGNFCEKCGAARTSTPITWICSNCGHKNAKGKFCETCGTSKTAKIEGWICTNCGRENTEGEFCEKCGMPQHRVETHSQQFVIKTKQQNSYGDIKKNKGVIGLIASITIAAILYFGYGYYVEKHYESIATELINITTDIGNSSISIKELTGDANSEETKTVVEKIDGEVERLTNIQKEFSDSTVPNDKKTQCQEIIKFIEAHKEVLSKANDILKCSDLLVNPINKNAKETVEKLVADFDKAKKEAKKINEINLKGENLIDKVQLDAMEKNLANYFEKKITRDAKFYQEKRKEYAERLNNENRNLKTKNELVFLPQEIFTIGQDLVIRGKFFNGTADRVTGFQEMKIDLKLKKMDEEIFSMNDYTISDKSLSNLFLMPKSQTSRIIELRLPGKAKDLDVYDNFVFYAHDIHWTARKKP